jgi:hypothetical protein
LSSLGAAVAVVVGVKDGAVSEPAVGTGRALVGLEAVGWDAGGIDNAEIARAEGADVGTY